MFVANPDLFITRSDFFNPNKFLSPKSNLIFNIFCINICWKKIKNKFVYRLFSSVFKEYDCLNLFIIQVYSQTIWSGSGRFCPDPAKKIRIRPDPDPEQRSSLIIIPFHLNRYVRRFSVHLIHICFAMSLSPQQKNIYYLIV